MKEKIEFIDEMLHAVQTTENEEVSSWFSHTEKKYNKSQKDIINESFGKIYDTLFIKPISEIKQETLEQVLYALLEDTDETSIRSKHQILGSIPETQTILDKKNILTKLAKPTKNPDNTFEGLSIQSGLVSYIQNSNNSILEILSDKDIQKHTLFQSIKSKLRGFLTFDQIEEVKNVILDTDTEIDFENQTIQLNESNICKRVQLWIVQKHIKPFVINRNINQEKQDIIRKYNTELTKSYIEVVDIYQGAIVIKPSKLKKITPEYIQKTISTVISKYKDLTITHTKGDNIQIIEDNHDVEKFIQQGFFNVLRDNNIDTNQYNIVDFSPATKFLTIGAPSIEKAKVFDEKICEFKKNHPQKRANFFDNMNRTIEYIISSSQTPTQKGNLGATIKKIIPSKEIVQEIDSSKSFDNAYVLNPTKKEVLIDMIESTQDHIAIIGEKGTGKTHIAHAIANHLKGQKTVVYTTGKDFYNHYQLLSSLDRQHKAKFGQMPKDNQSETFKFKESFKDTNVLIVDGIDFVSGTKSATQETIQQIVNKYKLQLIVTSPSELKDITRTQKVQEDGETYKQQLELFNVFDSIQPFHLEQNPRTKEQTLNNLRTEFLKSKKGSTLFSVTEIPYKAREMMIHKINPKRYKSLFTEFYSECARSEDDFLKILKNEANKGIPEMDEIITSISNIFFDSLEEIIKHTESEDLKWSEQILGRDANSTKNKILGSTAKNEEWKILAISVARIKNLYPNSKLSEIAKYLGTKTTSQVKNLGELGEDILRKNPKLSTKIGKKISDDFKQKYI